MLRQTAKMLLAQSLKKLGANSGNLPEIRITGVGAAEERGQTYFDVDIMEQRKATLSLRIVVTNLKNRAVFTHSVALCDSAGVLRAHDVSVAVGPKTTLDVIESLAYAADFIALHAITIGEYLFDSENWDDMMHDITAEALKRLEA